MSRPMWRHLTYAFAVMVGGAILVPAASPAAAAGGDAFYADSAPGDALGGGTARMTHTTEALAPSPDGSSIQVAATFTSGTSTERYEMTFSAPTGQALAAGTTYEDTGAAPTATNGAISVWSSVHGSCTPSSGAFAVRELSGGVAIDFRYQCEWSSGALYGSFRHQAVTDVRALTGLRSTFQFPDTAVSAGATSTTLSVASSGTTSTTITSIGLSGVNAAAFKVVSETCTGAPVPAGSSCAVTVAFDPAMGGLHAATLTLRDDTYRGTRSVALNGIGTLPSSPVAWGTTTLAGPNYTWNAGGSFGRTSTTTSRYLHAVASTDRVSGAWADDNGPYVGVVYSRRSESGSTWSAAKRLNPTTQHGDRVALATSGAYVYVAWVRTTKWIAYDPNAPRIIYFRRNASQGASTKWSSTRQITGSTAKVDYPTMAASGANIYLAYTNATTGTIRLAVSRDHGSTWAVQTVGATSYRTSDGYEGLPSVSAAGTNVIVSWTGDASGAVLVRTSATSAKTWRAVSTLASSATSYTSAKARGTRMAVAWPTPVGIAVRLWSTTGWGPTRMVGAAYGAGRSYRDHGTVQVAFGATGQVAVAWSACWSGCTQLATTARGPATAYMRQDTTAGAMVDLLWAESTNDGVSWYRGQVLGNASTSVARRIHDSPAIVWPTASRRYVTFNGWTPATDSYRIYLRAGTKP